MTPKFIHTRKELMGMTYLYIYNVRNTDNN